MDRGWRMLAGWLMSACLAGATGCLHCLNSVEPPCVELVETCHGMPRQARCHVNVFFVNGINPCCASLECVRAYVQTLGFTHTYCGEVYHGYWFTSEIRRIHEEEPEARFVLVGQGAGVNVVRGMACTLADDNIAIDLVLYVEGDRLQNHCCHPDNVCRAVRICGRQTRDEIAGVETLCLKDAGSYGAATHQGTLDLLADELMAIAGRVPVRGEPEAPAPEPGPTPRPVMPQVSAERDEWDFLKPTASLRLRAPDLGFAPADEQAKEGESVKPHSVLKPKSPPAEKSHPESE